MYSPNIFTVVAVLGLSGSILALPQATSDAATVPTDPISKYTVQVSTSDHGSFVVGFTNNLHQFFLDNVLSKPPVDSCVFYTFGLTQQALTFAVAQNKFTIWVSLLNITYIANNWHEINYRLIHCHR